LRLRQCAASFADSLLPVSQILFSLTGMRRAARRALSSDTLYTSAKSSTAMIVGHPFWRYPIAVQPPEPAARPLLEAMRNLEDRPYRIISHYAEDGKVFNASVFVSDEKMRSFLRWYDSNALQPGSMYHGCLTDAASGEALPTADSLLFGTGTQVLDDTRFGEYQLGMAVRYSVIVFPSEEVEAEARRVATTPLFEQRIAQMNNASGISYFGRLVMASDSRTWLSASRYGSIPEARKATELTRERFAPEFERWFASYTSIIGTASRLIDFDD